MKKFLYLSTASVALFLGACSGAIAQPPGPGQNTAIVDQPVVKGNCAKFVDSVSNHITDAGQPCGTGGGGGSPGGSPGQMQWNNAGSFGGITGATSDGSVVTLTNPNFVNPTLGTPASGNGVNLTNLNASNLASGTVPNARINGITIGGQVLSVGGSATTQGNGGKIQLSSGTVTSGNCAKFDASGNIVDNLSTCGAGGGSVSVTGASPNVVITPSPGTGTFTIGLTNFLNEQVGTTYTLLAGDNTKLVSFNNASAIAVGLPQATGSFASGWANNAYNYGAGIATITPSTSTISGKTTLPLGLQQGASIFSNGAGNYGAIVGLPQVAQYHILASTTTGNNYPSDVTLSGVLDGAIGSTTNTLAYRSAGGWVSLALGTNLSITSNTLNAAGGGGSGCTTSGTAVLKGDGAGGCGNVTIGSGLSLVGSTLSSTVTGTVTTSGSPATGNLATFSGATSITNGNLSGDVTTSGTLATTLATVNTNVGSFGDSTHCAAFTVNGKGLITAASQSTSCPGGGGGSSGVLPNYIANSYYTFMDVTAGATGASVSDNLTTRWYPVTVPKAVTISQLCGFVSTTSAGGNMQFAIASNNATTNLPSSVLANTGNISTTSGGVICGTLGSNQSLTVGIYWIGYQVDNSTSKPLGIQTFDNHAQYNIGATVLTDMYNTGGNPTQLGWIQGSTYGTWNTTSIGETNMGGVSWAPNVFFKAVSSP